MTGLSLCISVCGFVEHSVGVPTYLFNTSQTSSPFTFLSSSIKLTMGGGFICIYSAHYRGSALCLNIIICTLGVRHVTGPKLYLLLTDDSSFVRPTDHGSFNKLQMQTCCFWIARPGSSETENLFAAFLVRIFLYDAHCHAAEGDFEDQPQRTTQNSASS